MKNREKLERAIMELLEQAEERVLVAVYHMLRRCCGGREE